MLTSILAALAWLLIGGWGAVNPAQGDWFIGAVMLGCAVVGLCSLAVRVLRERHARSRGTGTPADTPTR
jgi:hypothetical protein